MKVAAIPHAGHLDALESSESRRGETSTLYSSSSPIASGINRAGRRPKISRLSIGCVVTNTAERSFERVRHCFTATCSFLSLIPSTCNGLLPAKYNTSHQHIWRISRPPRFALSGHSHHDCQHTADEQHDTLFPSVTILPCRGDYRSSDNTVEDALLSLCAG